MLIHLQIFYNVMKEKSTCLYAKFSFEKITNHWDVEQYFFQRLRLSGVQRLIFINSNVIHLFESIICSRYFERQNGAFISTSRWFHTSILSSRVFWRLTVITIPLSSEFSQDYAQTKSISVFYNIYFHLILFIFKSYYQDKG